MVAGIIRQTGQDLYIFGGIANSECGSHGPFNRKNFAWIEKRALSVEIAGE